MFTKMVKRILFLTLVLVITLTKLGWTQNNTLNEVSELSLAQKAFYYVQAVKNYDKNMLRLKQEGKPWEKYGVRTPADYLYALVSAERFFHENPHFRVDFTSERAFPPEECTELLALIREMQELSDNSPFQGNFRWYWGQDTVVDRNAVEFVMQRLLFCWKYRDLMPKSWEEPMREIIASAAPEVLRRTVNPEYTNIAVLNFSNLILLGEVLDQPTLVEEGIRRMERFTFYTWKNGIHEFSSQTYYATTLEGLEQLWDLSMNRRAKENVLPLLHYWFYSIALHYRPDGNWDRKCAGKLVGATSRTYNYMYGDQYFGYHLGALGWNKLPPEASNITIVTALNTSFRPPRYYGKMWKWSAEQLPISIVERWGETKKQYRKTWVTEDFSFGTAGKEYGSFQDQLWLLDWHENLTENTDKNQKRNTRSYFIPDGRSDPWGTAREITKGGHNKALHLNPAWSAIQNGPFARCRVVYDAELVKNFLNERPDGQITSVWVLKYPDSYEITRTRTRTETENKSENGTEAENLPQLRLRYGKYELCLTLESVRNGQVAEELIPSPDGNAVTWSVTHNVKTGMETGAEVVFTSMIRNVETENAAENKAQIGTKWEIPWKADWESDDETVWDMSLAQTGKVNRVAELKMTPNRNVPDELKVFADFTWKPEFALSDTLLIQTADGKEMRSGRDILGMWNTRLGNYAHRTVQMKIGSRNNYEMVKLGPGEKLHHPATRGLYYEPFAEGDTEGNAVTIQDDTYYFFYVEKSGNYRLSASVLAPDARRDSLQVTFWLPDVPKGVHYPCWALGHSPEWRTVAFSVPGNKKDSKNASKSENKEKIETETPGVLHFPAGPIILQLKPREYDVRVRELILERI